MLALTRYELPFSDPTPDLAPTAARILDAAKRVLARDGFRGLTFETIAKEAAENPALIRYHFGSKAGLLAALVDSVLYQEAVELIEQLAAVPAGDERRKELLALHEGLPEDTDAYRNFFELIPHILRDDELQPHLRGLFEWYRKLDAWALKGAGDKEPRGAHRADGPAHGGHRRRHRAAEARRSGSRLRAGVRAVAPARARVRRIGRRARLTRSGRRAAALL